MNGFPVTKEAVTNTVIDVRLSPAALAGGQAHNTTGTDGWIVFFDKPAADVTLGTTRPNYYVPVFSFSTAFLTRAGEGVNFEKAMSIAAVATLALVGPPAGITANVVMLMQ